MRSFETRVEYFLSQIAFSLGRIADAVERQVKSPEELGSMLPEEKFDALADIERRRQNT